MKLHGGTVEAFLPIHQWFDATKECYADFRHRALRHHSQGIFECERQFGPAIDNGAGKMVPTRIIGEQHVREDCGGRVPTVEDWLKGIPAEGWMNRGHKIEPMP